MFDRRLSLYVEKSAYNILLNVGGGRSDVIGFTYIASKSIVNIKDKNIFKLVWVSGLYPIYINGEGGYPCARRLQKTNTCEHRATGSLHVTAYVCRGRNVQTLSRRPRVRQSNPIPSLDNTAWCTRCWSEAGGGGSSTRLLFLYSCGMTEKPIALIFHCLSFFSCLFSTAATTADWSEIICLVYFNCLSLLEL